MKTPLQALSWNSMLKVFSETFWIAITMMIILMIVVLSWFGEKFSLKSIISAKIAITMALLGQTFREESFLKVFCFKNIISLVITAKHFFMLIMAHILHFFFRIRIINGQNQSNCFASHSWELLHFGPTLEF